MANTHISPVNGDKKTVFLHPMDSSCSIVQMLHQEQARRKEEHQSAKFQKQRTLHDLRKGVNKKNTLHKESSQSSPSVSSSNQSDGLIENANSGSVASKEKKSPMA